MRGTMKAVTKIVFCDDENEKFFGEGPCRLLQEVERTGSMNAAAAAQHMAYTKALKLLKNAEKALGFPLTNRTTGGRSGGGSTLTPEGKRWMERYMAYRDACLEANRKLYLEFFPEQTSSHSEESKDRKKAIQNTDALKKAVQNSIESGMISSTGLVIMASGQGKRFGSNKLLADFGGQPLIQRILDTTENLFRYRVVVTRHEDVQKICEEREIPVLFHDCPGRNDTIRLGLQAIDPHGNQLKTCIFVPADQPLLTGETLRKLAEASCKDPAGIFRTAFEGQMGAPTAFPAWCFEELRNLPEGKGGNVLIKNYPDIVKSVSAGSQAELLDVDTPEDLEALLEILKKERLTNIARQVSAGALA